MHTQKQPQQQQPQQSISVRVSKVKGHADDAMVLHGQVRRDDKLGNDAADEAADFGRRRISPAVIDAPT